MKKRKINISELPKEVPNFDETYEQKQNLVKKWLVNWITSGLSNSSIKENDILPTKAELSEHLGVSLGTVQNAIRSVEDEGYLKSKQRTGTMISNYTNPINTTKKSTSKRDKTVILLKKYIVDNNLTEGNPLPSSRKMAEILNISVNTARLAYEYLELEGILTSISQFGRDAKRIVKSIPKIKIENSNIESIITADTLVIKLTEEIRSYILTNYNVGEKIPSHEDLADKFQVSIKTIHDVISNLSQEGILITRRGRYGTILANKQVNSPNIQDLMFASAEEAITYSYQKIEQELIDLIIDSFKIGDKLPSMLELSLKFDVSTNTIRKALTSLEEQGYVTFQRGRFGGTFVLEKPEADNKESYQWLAISPDYIQAQN